jgi:hypothetical protein
MREYRATPIEVSAEAEDPLLTFRPESGNAAVIATHQSAHLESRTLVRQPRTINARRGTGWREGLLLFLSGAAVGILCAIVLSLDWEATADTGADVQPGLETEQSRTTPASTSGSIPLPVEISQATQGSVSPAGAAMAATRTVDGLSSSFSGYRGALRVNSQPRGASVFINERYVGRTPMVLRSLPVGSRAVRLRLDGYAPWSRGVNIVANEFTTVAAKLNPAKTID